MELFIESEIRWLKVYKWNIEALYRTFFLPCHKFSRLINSSVCSNVSFVAVTTVTTVKMWRWCWSTKLRWLIVTMKTLAILPNIYLETKTGKSVFCFLLFLSDEESFFLEMLLYRTQGSGLRLWKILSDFFPDLKSFFNSYETIALYKMKSIFPWNWWFSVKSIFFLSLISTTNSHQPWQLSAGLNWRALESTHLSKSERNFAWRTFLPPSWCLFVLTSTTALNCPYRIEAALLVLAQNLFNFFLFPHEELLNNNSYCPVWKYLLNLKYWHRSLTKTLYLFNSIQSIHSFIFSIKQKTLQMYCFLIIFITIIK